ncbi:MAG: AGE family epimerase/isomerase [Pseudobdellovibrio sp.]
MNATATELIHNANQWLKESVFPLWNQHGIDPKNGSFVESLSLQGLPIDLPRRALVQARQIYAYSTAAKLNVCEIQFAHGTVKNAALFLTHHYFESSGACIHSVSTKGEPHNKDLDLYTQAFALFALANAFEVTNDTSYQQKALSLLNYLNSHRKTSGGGYTEIKNGQTTYQSNPHMHLFEAALCWLQIDPHPAWKTLANELFELCKTKFIDTATGSLCETFHHDWVFEKITGSFVFEPGHHYEWAWLLSWYQDLSGQDSFVLRHKLYSIAENHGLNTEKNLAIDEVYSDFTKKKNSSRFWPQCERIKACVKLGLESPIQNQPAFAKSADQAMTALFEYFNLPIKGLWQDVLLENGQFTQQDPKASSLYHIINAMSEYIILRPKLNDVLK